MIPTYPKDSVQTLIGPNSWWVNNETQALRRGCLLLGYVPHVDQIPTRVTVIGRADPTCHDRAHVQFSPFSVGNPPPRPALPVAALPAYSGEAQLVYRAKKRPLLVIAESGPEVDHKLIRGKPKWQTAPTLLVSPFYGRDEGTGNRSGFTDAFVECIKKCEYPQFFWEKLPLPGAGESILRFDHIQPIGNHYKTYEITQYRLGEDALSLIDEWLIWFIYGFIEEDGILKDVFECLRE